MYLSQKIPIIDPNHSVIMFRHGFGQNTPSGCNWRLAKESKWPRSPQNDPFYAITKNKSRMMKLFLPNLLVSMNVASVKCKRVETAKKYGPEHGISPKNRL